MPDDGQTYGFWVGSDDDRLEEFDDTFSCGPEGSTSRSEEIKRALELAVTVEQALVFVDLDDIPWRSKLMTVRQAILDSEREE